MKSLKIDIWLHALLGIVVFGGFAWILYRANEVIDLIYLGGV